MPADFENFLSTPPEILKTKTLIISVFPESEYGQTLNLAKSESEVLEVKLYMREELVKANPASTTK